MKTKKADSYDRRRETLVYTIGGREVQVWGEFYRNLKKNRIEHTHIGPRGGETLIWWPLDD